MAAPTGHIVSYGVGLGNPAKERGLSGRVRVHEGWGLGRSCSTSLLGVLGEAVGESGLRSCRRAPLSDSSTLPWDGYVDEQFDELGRARKTRLAGIATW